jgi:hypothetical protein
VKARRVWAFVAVAWMVAVAALAAEPTTREAAYQVSELKVRYYRENPWVPPVADLMNAEVTLGLENGGWAALREGGKGVTLKLRELGKGEIQKIYPGALRVIYEGILKALNDRGIIGVYVTVDSADIGTDGADLRAGRRDLTMVVVVSTVKEVRTLRQDNDLPEAERVNNPRDAQILQGSPVKAMDDKGGGGPNLLNKKALDEYVLRLNGEAGLHVEVAITGTERPGEVVLDYLVTRGAASRPATAASRP